MAQTDVMVCPALQSTGGWLALTVPTPGQGTSSTGRVQGHTPPMASPLVAHKPTKSQPGRTLPALEVSPGDPRAELHPAASQSNQGKSLSHTIRR